MARQGIKDLDRLRALGAAGRERVLRDFTLDVFLERHAELYGAMIEEGG